MEATQASSTLFDNSIDTKTERLFSYVSLSKYLSVPVKTIQDWVYKRKIPFVKAGRHIRFIRSEIQEWLRKGAKNGSYND